MSDRLPQQIGAGVRRELERLGPGGAMTELTTAWPVAVGETIARNAWPARLGRDGTLLVHTGSAVWAFELAQLERTIRERLGAAAPARLRFAVGPLPATAAETAPTPCRETHEVSEVEQRAGEEIASAIEDPELREVVAHAAAASLASARRPRSNRRVW